MVTIKVDTVPTVKEVPVEQKRKRLADHTGNMRKLIALSADYEGFANQLCDFEVLIVRYGDLDSLNSMVLNSPDSFNQVINAELDGRDIHGFYAVPIHTRRELKRVRERADLEPEVITTIKRPTENFVLSAIRQKRSVKEWFED